MTNRKPSPSAASILLCSCEDSMPLDPAAVERGCRGAKLTTARQLCRKELALARSLAETSQALTIACTQEVRVFEEMAEAVGRAGRWPGPDQLCQRARTRRLVRRGGARRGKNGGLAGRRSRAHAAGAPAGGRKRGRRLDLWRQ